MFIQNNYFMGKIVIKYIFLFSNFLIIFSKFKRQLLSLFEYMIRKNQIYIFNYSKTLCYNKL